MAGFGFKCGWFVLSLEICVFLGYMPWCPVLVC